MLYFSDLDNMTKLLFLNLIIIATSVVISMFRDEHKVAHTTTKVYLLGIVITAMCWMANAVADITAHTAHSSADGSLEPPAPWMFNALMLVSMLTYVIGVVTRWVRARSEAHNSSEAQSLSVSR